MFEWIIQWCGCQNFCQTMKIVNDNSKFEVELLPKADADDSLCILRQSSAPLLDQTTTRCCQTAHRPWPWAQSSATVCEKNTSLPKCFAISFLLLCQLSLALGSLFPPPLLNCSNKRNVLAQKKLLFAGVCVVNKVGPQVLVRNQRHCSLPKLIFQKM